MIVTIAILLLLSYSMLAGVTEGVLYSKKASEAFKWNEHAIFVAHRACIGFIFLLPDALHLYDKLAIIGFWILGHSFFHDGAYFETRGAIDIPHYKWYYNKSKTSTARFELSFWIRTLMFIVGCIWMFVYFKWLK